MTDVPVIPVKDVELVQLSESKIRARVAAIATSASTPTIEEVAILQQFVIASYLSQLSRQAMAAAATDGP